MDMHLNEFIHRKTFNIELLLRELRGSSKRDGSCCISVEFNSAYNIVQSDLLYGFFEQKSVV